MGFYEQLNQARAQIKHTPESVDLQDLRGLLGYAQDRDEMLSTLIGGDLSMFAVEEDGFEAWDVVLTVRMDSRQRKDLMLLIGDD